MFPLHELTLRDLTMTLVMLMNLTQDARIQNLHLLLLSDMLVNSHPVSVRLGGNLQQTRPRNFTLTGLHSTVTLRILTSVACYLNTPM